MLSDNFEGFPSPLAESVTGQLVAWVGPYALQRLAESPHVWWQEHQHLLLTRGDRVRHRRAILTVTRCRSPVAGTAGQIDLRPKQTGRVDRHDAA